jgi:hypothetical protein
MRVITLATNKTIISVKNVGDNYILESNDIVSEIGDIGQIQKDDGSFITPAPTPQPTPITLEELQNNQLTLMDAFATLYEGLLAKGSI